MVTYLINEYVNQKPKKKTSQQKLEKTDCVIAVVEMNLRNQIKRRNYTIEWKLNENHVIRWQMVLRIYHRNDFMLRINSAMDPLICWVEYRMSWTVKMESAFLISSSMSIKTIERNHRLDFL